MTDEKNDMLLFYYRATEPCFMQKGDEGVVFQLPPNYYVRKFLIHIRFFISIAVINDADKPPRDGKKSPLPMDIYNPRGVENASPALIVGCDLRSILQ